MSIRSRYAKRGATPTPVSPLFLCYAPRIPAK
nr:MAG TPA: hypothetical protein [Caudoviricetes sp.]